MKRSTAICIAIFTLLALLLPSPPACAEELNLAEFPVSDDRMAVLAEQAADGNLTISDFSQATWPSRVQILFLEKILNVHRLDLRATAVDNTREAWFCKAASTARAGNLYDADILLENCMTGDYIIGDPQNQRRCYVAVYRRWNGDRLSYDFLRWWVSHVSGENSFWATLTFFLAAQFLALPLLLKLRTAIKAGRRGRTLTGLSLASAFAVFVPTCWAAANGPAWAAAFKFPNLGESFLLPIELSIIFNLGAPVLFLVFFRKSHSLGASIAITFLLFCLGGILARIVLAIPFLILCMLPFYALKESGLISEMGGAIGADFWAGNLAILVYFLWLARKQKLSRA